MRYNNLISPLTTLYGNLWHQSMYYLSYMTLHDIQEIFSTSMENQNYTVFRLWFFLYDLCMISRKSYMVLVSQPRIHTNHIRPGMITRNHIWPSTKSKKVVWSLTRVSSLDRERSYCYCLKIAVIAAAFCPLEGRLLFCWTFWESIHVKNLINRK